MTMKDLIEKLKNQKQPTDGRLIQRRDNYVKAVAQLIVDIQKWLEPAARDNIMTLSVSTVDRTEEDLGTYPVQELTIRLVNRDGLIVKIEPIGAMIVGTVGSRRGRPVANLRGRVELSCGPMRIPFGLTESGVWKAIPLQGEPREVDEQTFAEILGEVLLDG